MVQKSETRLLLTKRFRDVREYIREKYTPTDLEEKEKRRLLQLSEYAVTVTKSPFFVFHFRFSSTCVIQR